MLLAKFWNVDRVIFEGDNKSIMESLENKYHWPNSFCRFFRRSGVQFRVFCVCIFRWCSRQVNGVTNVLCWWANRYGFSNFLMWGNSRPFVQEIIEVDAMFEWDVKGLFFSSPLHRYLISGASVILKIYIVHCEKINEHKTSEGQSIYEVLRHVATWKSSLSV